MMRPMTSSTRDFTSIGVIGLGTMGAGIAEVFARNGYQVVGVEQTEETLERGRQHVEHSTGRAVKRGKLQRGAAGRAGRPDHVHHRHGRRQGLRPGRRGGRRAAARSSSRSSGRSTRSSAPDAVLATNTSSLSVTEISTATSHPGRVIGVHFFNPAPVQNLVEIIRTVVTEPDVLEDAAELARSLQKTPVVVGDKAGFIANALLFGYLNHAASMFEEQLRHPRGPRRRDAVRLRLPDGPAGAARPDRPGHGVRDPGHDVQAGPRPAARARPRSSSRWSPPACSAGSPAAASTPTRPPTARSSSTTRSPRRPTTCRGCATTSASSAWSAPARWPPGSSRCSPRPASRSRTSGAAHDKVDAVRATIEKSLDKAIQRGKLEESAREEVLGRLTGTTSLDDLGAASTSSSRRSPRTSRSSRCCSRTSTRSASRARSWPPPPPRCR